MTIYKLWLNSQDWGHCYSFTAAHRWRTKQLEAGADPVGCYITKGRLPTLVPIYGPLERVD